MLQHGCRSTWPHIWIQDWRERWTVPTMSSPFYHVFPWSSSSTVLEGFPSMSWTKIIQASGSHDGGEGWNSGSLGSHNDWKVQLRITWDRRWSFEVQGSLLEVQGKNLLAWNTPSVPTGNNQEHYLGGYVAAGAELGFCVQEEGSGIDIGPATSHVCYHARFSHRGLVCAVISNCLKLTCDSHFVPWSSRWHNRAGGADSRHPHLWHLQAAL